MKKVIKKSFGIIIKNSAIMQPLIIYILLMLFFSSIMGSRAFSNPIIGIIFSALMFLLLTAFLSGWFSTIKYAVDNYINFDKQKKDYPMKIAVYNFDTGKNFFSGVSEYFGSILTVVLVYSLFCGLIFTLGMKFFHITNSDIYALLSSSDDLSNYINNNSLTFGVSILIISSIIQIFQFIIIFWTPAILYTTNNPIKSFGIALKFLFKNFFYSIGLYFFILISLLLVNLLSIICAKVYLLSLLFLIFELYFATYVLVLIFTAYKEKIMQSEIEKINSQDVFIKSSELKERKDADQE